MKPHEYEEARARAERLGMNFSAYINALIRADMREGGDLRLREDPLEKNSDSIGVSAAARKKVSYRKGARKQ